MSRLVPAFSSALFLLVAVTASAQQATTSAPPSPVPAPVPAPVALQQTVPTATYESASPRSVLPAAEQNALERVTGLLSQKYFWKSWTEVSPGILKFLADRDPATSRNIKPGDIMTFFNIDDIDKDGRSDLALRLGTRDSCAETASGCVHAMYYADKAKGRVVVNARSMLPVRNGFIIHNRFYAIQPHAGDTYTGLSYTAFKIGFSQDPATFNLHAVFKKLNPEYYVENLVDPNINYTYYDLNNDGKMELIFFIADDDEGFCTEDDPDACAVFVYETNAKGMPQRQLGLFYARPALVIGRAAKKGYADIIVEGQLGDLPSLRTYSYTMDPKTGRYVPQ